MEVFLFKENTILSRPFIENYLFLIANVSKLTRRSHSRRRNKPRVQNFLPTLSDDLPEIPETQAIPQTQAISQTPEQMMAMLPPPLPMVDTDEKAELVFSTLKPFDRWKIDYRWSQEPAEVLHITDAMLRSPQRAAENVEALAHNDAPTEYAPSNILEFGTNASSSEFDTFWAQSMASYSTGLTGVASTSYLSDHTAFSYQPSSAGFLDTKSLNSFDDIKPRRRCNAKRAIKERSQGGKFQCTFCNNRTFKTKHDWQRHEKSQHLNIESWACCAFGGTIETAQGPICAFCNHPYPSVEHLETHHFSACQSKGLSERTFYRKDHFVQHLHLVHECGMNSCMDIWRVELDIISRCGFCNMQLTSWKNRADHLAAHFKTGSKMSDWRGDLGFEEHINAIIDFGTDFDPKRFDPDFCWTTSSRATQVSSLDYQGDAGNDLSKQLLNAPLSRVSSTQLSATPQNGDSLYGGLVSEPGITMGERTVGQARLYDIFECVAGTPCDS